MDASQVLLVQTEKGTMVNELVHNSTFVALISVSYKVQGSGLCEQGISPQGSPLQKSQVVGNNPSECVHKLNY